MRRLLSLTVLVAAFVATAPSPAEAATYTSAGHRCTKVGTSGNDVLKGTSYADVICGLGGNDTIYAYGGNDVVDAGSGSDRVYASTGSDRVYAGSGNDTVSTDTGNDTVFGGTGADQVSAGSGADLLYGQDGHDRLNGGSGTDKQYGGIGDDWLRGGDDNDVLGGQEGNDDLSGENGSDALDGGLGTNWCTVGATDTQRACVYDKTAPAVWWAGVSPNPVDVTYGDKTITVKVHILDDTGVSSVQLRMQDFETAALGPDVFTPQLVSGTIRDGIWQASGVARRYSEPGAFELGVDVRDRVGRWTHKEFASAITVKNATPDRQNAAVASVKLDKTSVDVRSGSATITTIARITDDASGVELGDALLCLYSPGGGGSYTQHGCQNMERYSGTARDGYWRYTASIPKGAIGGDWNVGVWVNDKVHRGSPRYYVGEDVYRYYSTQWGPDSTLFQLANARFAVLGTSDNTAAWLAGAKVDKTSVDTLASSQTVTLDVHAKDATGEGVTEVGVHWAPEGGDGNGGASFRPIDAVRVSGTAVDGVWRAVLTMPQGTPPGRYCLSQVWVVDKGHWRSFTPACSPFHGEAGQTAVPASQLSTASGAAWDGWVTVVDSSTPA